MAQANGRVGFEKAVNLLEDFEAGKFAPNGQISDLELDEYHLECVKEHRADAGHFLIFAQIYMQRRRWHKALSNLYCRCYLDKSSDEHRQTLQMCRSVELQMLEDITKVPRAVKAALFTRDVFRGLLKWQSQLFYTSSMESAKVDEGIALAALRRGQLVFKSRPFACAPWSCHVAVTVVADGGTPRFKNCFHCLELITNVVDLALETSRVLVACHKDPYGCPHQYCSRECFLNNATVHEIECAAIPPIGEFSRCKLSFSLCLVVARSLIRCYIQGDLGGTLGQPLTPTSSGASTSLGASATPTSLGVSATSTSLGASATELEGSGRSLDSLKKSGLPFTSSRESGGALGGSGNCTPLNAILNTVVPLEALERRYPKHMQELRQYARFLLDVLGLKVCMHLTPRELYHFAVVIWLYSIPMVPLQGRLNGEMLGGAVFCLDLLSWDHCLAGKGAGAVNGAGNVGSSCKPNCNVYFDAGGRLTIRSRASISAGTRLSIDKALDVYDLAGGRLDPCDLPFTFSRVRDSLGVQGLHGSGAEGVHHDLRVQGGAFRGSGGASGGEGVQGGALITSTDSGGASTSQGGALGENVAQSEHVHSTSQGATLKSNKTPTSTYKWIIPSLDDYAHATALDTASFIRCSVCVTGFCVATAVDSSKDANSATTSVKRLKWRCLDCGIDDDNDHGGKLNLLLSKAEYIVQEAYRLNQQGQHLAARRMLEDFVYNWSGVLHPNHYLLYNAQVLLAGIYMNCAGSNYRLALEYLTCAILSLEQRCPWPLQDKGHLYTTLANLCLGIYKTSRGGVSLPFKSLGVEAAIDSLWNWTMVAGCNDVATLDALKLCRMVAFEFNIHVPPNMHQVAIVVPGKFLQVFQSATGNTSTIPKHFDNSLENVASLAFMAAQQGLNNEPLLNVMTTLEARGIQQLGTGLGCLGIAASYAHENLVEALCKAIEASIALELDKLATIDVEESTVVQTSLLNLIAAIVGANELGTTPLLAVSSLCTNDLGNGGVETDNGVVVGGSGAAGLDENDSQHRRQVMVARHLTNLCKRLDTLLDTHKGAANLRYTYKLSLLKSLFDANTHARLNCQTPLHYAAARGNVQLVEFLCKNSTCIGRMNLEGATPLHLAAQFGRSKVVKTLINFGAKVHVAMNSGEYPIHLAVHSLDEATVDLFIDFYQQWAGESEVVVEHGPSLWHALVEGIFYNVGGGTRSSTACGAALETTGALSTFSPAPFKLLISRTGRAIEIAKRLHAKLADCRIFKMYSWANLLPSQALWERFRPYIERPSDFCGGSGVGKDSETLMAATRTFEMLRRLLTSAEHVACAQ